MIKLLDDYVSRAIAGGFTVEKYNAVSNPCVNFALDFSEKMLSEAQKNGFAAIGDDLQIEIESGWQLLSFGSASIGYNDFITHLTRLMEACFRSQLGLPEPSKHSLMFGGEGSDGD